MAALVAGHSPAPLQDGCSPEGDPHPPSSSPRSEHNHMRALEDAQQLHVTNETTNAGKHRSGSESKEDQGAHDAAVQAYEEEHGAQSACGQGATSWRASTMVSAGSHSMDVSLDGIPPEIRAFLMTDPVTLTVPSELFAHLHDADASMGFRAFSPAASEFAHQISLSPSFGQGESIQHDDHQHGQEGQYQQAPYVEAAHAHGLGSTDDDTGRQGSGEHGELRQCHQDVYDRHHEQQQLEQQQRQHQQRWRAGYAVVPPTSATALPTSSAATAVDTRNMPQAAMQPSMMGHVSMGQQPLLVAQAGPGVTSIPSMYVVARSDTLLLHTQPESAPDTERHMHAGVLHNTSSPATSTCSSMGEDAAPHTVQPTASAMSLLLPAPTISSSLMAAHQDGASTTTTPTMLAVQGGMGRTGGRVSPASSAAPPTQRRRRRRTIPRFVQPQRSQFDSDEAYAAALHRWKEYREKNNASVRKSRERARERDLVGRRVLRDIERRRQQLVATASTLRSNLRLLLHSFFDAESLSPLETAWVQTLVRSKDGLQLATEATLTS